MLSLVPPNLCLWGQQTQSFVLKMSRCGSEPRSEGLMIKGVDMQGRGRQVSRGAG